MTHTMLPDHTQARRDTIWYTVKIIGFTALVFAALSWIAADRTRHEINQETSRADNALVARQQACDLLAQLGERCPTLSSQLTDSPRGRTGPQGEPGRPPTQAEIAAAVAAYFAEHPPAAGPQGPPGAPGEPATGCPLLGHHFELLTARVIGAETKTRTWLACVAD